jgi:hypothetical protein
VIGRPSNCDRRSLVVLSAGAPGVVVMADLPFRLCRRGGMNSQHTG